MVVRRGGCRHRGLVLRCAFVAAAWLGDLSGPFGSHLVADDGLAFAVEGVAGCHDAGERDEESCSAVSADAGLVAAESGVDERGDGFGGDVAAGCGDGGGDTAVVEGLAVLREQGGRVPVERPVSGVSWCWFGRRSVGHCPDTARHVGHVETPGINVAVDVDNVAPLR